MLIIVAGNRDRGDDAAGLLIGDRLAQPLPADSRLIDASRDPTRILDHLPEVDRVLIVDALRSGAPPGTIHRVDGLDRLIGWDGVRRSTHGLGVVEVLQLAKEMGLWASDVSLLGIEGRDFGFGAPTPEVERAVGEAVVMVTEMLGRAPVDRMPAAEAPSGARLASGRHA